MLFHKKRITIHHWSIYTQTCESPHLQFQMPLTYQNFYTGILSHVERLFSNPSYDLQSFSTTCLCYCMQLLCFHQLWAQKASDLVGENFCSPLHITVVTVRLQLGSWYVVFIMNHDAYFKTTICTISARKRTLSAHTPFSWLSVHYSTRAKPQSRVIRHKEYPQHLNLKH